MNRDRFKFRVWSEKLNRYYWSYAITVDGDLVPWMEGIGTKGEDPGSKLTIEQCTGLTDRNGKLIYEGDIVVFVDGATHPIEVFWDGIGWKFRRNGKSMKFAFDCDIISHIKMCEIIGNIHDMEQN